ncbi:MAG: hypothetical protein EOO77_05055 [Oxalobacteraceae bacterium]|nr:MAG: hypothetical protein EOO77_05055 [Oxalobacteraceae bacterium]
MLILLPIAIQISQVAPQARQQPAATANAAEPAPVPAADDIVVVGTTRARIADMVKRLTGGSSAQIPRWNTSLCVVVRNVLPNRARYIADTIGKSARAIGVAVEGGSCRPNVEIIISGQADTLVRQFLRRQPSMFRDVARYGRPRSRDRAELLDPEPVRWTIGTTTETRLGVASRLSLPSRENKEQLLVVVDLARCGDVTLDQLSGYLTMVVLANPEHDSRGDRGSIMSLFNDPASSARFNGLTDLDRSLLEALYATEERASAGSQRIAMTDRILRERTAGIRK